MISHQPIFSFFFFNDTATTEIYTLSLHDALPIYQQHHGQPRGADGRVERRPPARFLLLPDRPPLHHPARSEEHTSELQSPCNLVCRLLLEKKNNTIAPRIQTYALPSYSITMNLIS